MMGPLLYKKVKVNEAYKKKFLAGAIQEGSNFSAPSIEVEKVQKNNEYQGSDNSILYSPPGDKKRGKKLTPKEFTEKFYGMVKDATKGTGLHPEAVMAQMATESSWAGSSLSANHHAYFGIKAHGYKNSVSYMSDEVINGVRKPKKSNFRAYNSVKESVDDYVKFLKTNSRYKGVFNLSTPEAQIDAIGKSGYATGPKYTELLKKVMRSIEKHIPKGG